MTRDPMRTSMPGTDRDLKALRAEQARLADEVVLEDELPDAVETVAGFDASYGETTCYGALVLVDVSGLETIETVTATAPIGLPYIPGLLAYRELPALDAVWSTAEERALTPDVLLVDGGGIIHPRRIGSASHAGVRHDVPTVGITKNLLLGEVDEEPAGYGETSAIRDEGELIGYAYRSSRRASTPIYTSPGHRVTPATALSLVEACCTGERKLPEPVHRAHVAATTARKDAESSG